MSAAPTPPAIIKPPDLPPGAVVGLAAPSSASAARYPARLLRALENLAALGYQPRLSRHLTARTAYTAGTAAQRAADLHELWSDPQVQAIICASGGHNSNQLLPLLDYDLIAANPKILLGYSDITALLAGIHRRTGLVTFHGPLLISTFGDFGGLHPYTRRYMQAVLGGFQPPLTLEPSPDWFEEDRDYSLAYTQPPRLKPAPGWRVLKPGRARGKIVAGNLVTMLHLFGTPYQPDFEGCILFIEDNEREDPPRLDRCLTQLRLTGVFERIAGLVLGRFPTATGFTPEASLEGIVERATSGRDFPVLLDFDFGHTDPLVTLPLGVMAELDCDRLSVTLLEAATL